MYYWYGVMLPCDCFTLDRKGICYEGSSYTQNWTEILIYFFFCQFTGTVSGSHISHTILLLTYIEVCLGIIRFQYQFLNNQWHVRFLFDWLHFCKILNLAKHPNTLYIWFLPTSTVLFVFILVPFFTLNMKVL